MRPVDLLNITPVSYTHLTMQFYDWFIKEQGEEENNAETLIRKYELFGTDPKGLYSLNQELAGRTYVAPTLTL